MKDQDIVDLVTDIYDAVTAVATSITPCAVPANDATGGDVGSLTEAVMGITAGLVKVADAISDLASSVRLLVKD